MILPHSLRWALIAALYTGLLLTGLHQLWPLANQLAAASLQIALGMLLSLGLSWLVCWWPCRGKQDRFSPFEAFLGLNAAVAWILLLLPSSPIQ
ncbi:MAG: hypothetical protein IGS03_08900 [Candidatus Sericytochromatia bacterium]|nr:hypothetical protein [Candidatus Sericytochromatia bacterium]